jgi:glycosyltransferase involved in cell wall biosynthesis
MRILMILTYYHPHWTGLTAYAKRLAEGLARRGHAVTVLTSRHEPQLPLEESIAGVRVIRLPVKARVSRGVVMPGFPAAVWRLARQADVVQLHTPILEAPLVTLFGRLLRKPVVLTHHGDLTMPAGLFNQTVERVVTMLMRGALRRATRLVTYSSDYARNSAFLAPFLHKTDPILPPVVIPRPLPGAAEAWKQELGLSGRKLVGFAGRWVEEKGFDYLLQAIPRVIKDAPDVHFVYAGETRIQYEDFFSRCADDFERVRSSLTLLGLVTDPQRLAAFYDMLDVFVLPSRTDCFALVQAEAMLCGTPVVVTDIPGARVAVLRTGMGLLVPPRNPAGLAAGILEVLSEPERFSRPREDIEAIFDPERCVSEYEHLLGRLAVVPADRETGR